MINSNVGELKNNVGGTSLNTKIEMQAIEKTMLGV